MADIPVTREEKYLAYLTGDYKADIPKPITRQERYLYELCLKRMGGEISPEEIKNAVNEYLEKNPVKPGATTEEAAQIKKNAAEINSLKESISTKITKFYASSQGETHITDSDNGKIQDMMLYGRSEQKQYSGKNLINGAHLSFLKGAIMFDIDKVIVNGTISEELGASFSKIQLKAGTYTLSSSFNCISKIGINPNLGILNADNKFKTLTINEDMEINLVVIVPSGSHNSIDYIMLNEGSDALPWEPYTGGQPSPSPDYPQEIKSVVNPTVKVCGKNLFGGKAFVDKIVELGGTLDEANKTVTISGAAIDEKTLFEFPDSSKQYTIILSGTNTNASTQSANLKGNISGSLKRFQNGISVTTLSSDNETLVGTYETGSVIYNYDQCGIFEGVLTYDDYEPYHEHTVTLPYTLNAIPVNSGGNVTIDGQQYVSDYFDVERGKLVRMVGECNGNNMFNVSEYGTANIYQGWIFSCTEGKCARQSCACSHLILISEEQHYAGTALGVSHSYDTNNLLGITLPKSIGSVKQYFIENNVTIFYQLETPIEIDLTEEEIAAFKALATYYPVTNISINSEELDGYTVFNYPISMQNGWNYVKQQIGDTRDYIYDMDARTQDTDLQAAEAYVNSEYAVALTELEV